MFKQALYQIASKICVFLYFLFVLFGGELLADPIVIDGIVVSGSEADKQSFIDLIQEMTGGKYQVGVDGKVSVKDGFSGSGTAADYINTILGDTVKTETIYIGRDMPGVLVGAWDWDGKGAGHQAIDLNDVAMFGADATKGLDTKGSVLIHEIWEGYQGATGKNYNEAHVEGIKSENALLKSTGGETYGQRGDDSGVITGSGYLDMPFSSKSGDTYYQRIYYTGDKITSVSMVPEPSITLLMGLGIIGMRYVKRRKTRSVV